MENTDEKYKVSPKWKMDRKSFMGVTRAAGTRDAARGVKKSRQKMRLRSEEGLRERKDVIK